MHRGLFGGANVERDRVLDVDADLVVALPDNRRGDLSEEIPKGEYRVFFGQVV